MNRGSELAAATPARRSRVRVLSALALFLAACQATPPPKPPMLPGETRPEFLARTTGRITGVVRAAESGLPIPNVSASSQYLGGPSDPHGRYEVPYQDPGRTIVEFTRRGRERVRVPVEIVAGKTVELDVSMELAPPACCALEGRWELTLRPTEGWPFWDRPAPVTARLVFDRQRPHHAVLWQEDPFDPTVDWFGDNDLDLSTLDGKPKRADSPLGDFLSESHGWVADGDHVTIQLGYRVADAGVGLIGRIEGDRIEGRWFIADYSPRFGGTFEMRRIADEETGTELFQDGSDPAESDPIPPSALNFRANPSDRPPSGPIPGLGPTLR